METMFEVPSRENIKKVLVTKESVENSDVEPEIVLKDQEESA